jgi:hypothetical protein
MERASSVSLRSLVTALAVVAGIAAIWVAAALANGPGDTGSSAGDSVQAELVQSQPEEEAPEDGTPFDEEFEQDFFDGGGGFDGDCPFGEGDSGDGSGTEETEPDADSAADL